MSSFDVKSLESSCAFAAVSSLRNRSSGYVRDLKSTLPSLLLEKLKKEEEKVLSENRQSLKKARDRFDRDSMELRGLRGQMHILKENLSLWRLLLYCSLTKVKELNLKKCKEDLEKEEELLVIEKRLLRIGIGCFASVKLKLKEIKEEGAQCE